MMRYLLIIISILFHTVSYECQANVDSIYYSYRYKDKENVFEVYKVDQVGKYELIDLLKLKNKRGRTFFISGEDTVYTLLAKNDSKVNPPNILHDSLNKYDFNTPFESGFIDLTFICLIDKSGKLISNAIIYPGSLFTDLDFKLLDKLMDIFAYWEPAKIKGKPVRSIIIGKYNFITGDLKWQW